MGYKAEKDKIERKIRVIKLVLLCVLLTALVGLCVFAAFCPPDTWKYHVKKPDVSAREEGELRIHFLDVGQGDCTLIELPDGKVALIDGGGWLESTSTSILRYMNALDIDDIDYLVATHADGDHVGGLARIVENKNVFNAYLPAVDATKAGSYYAKFYAALMEENCEKHYSERGISLSGETYSLTFVYPYALISDEETGEADANEFSSVIWLEYQEVGALFTGDAPKSTETALMRDEGLGLLQPYGVELIGTEILKVSHHGSADGTSLEFLNYLQTETAVISCGENNPYGHPSEEVRESLSLSGADVYRTDERGNVMITISSDGTYKVSWAR